ncbi:hypothetical protein NL676_016671 [Syzygium grande]|nr:hypothetical protein NL676_016671 [Syzygium grande]
MIAVRRQCSRCVSSDLGVPACLARVGGSVWCSLSSNHDNVSPGRRCCSNGLCGGSIRGARTPSTSLGCRASLMKTRGFATSDREGLDLASMSNVRRPDQEAGVSDPLESTSPVYSEADVEEVCVLLLRPEDWDSTREALEKCNVSFTSELVVEVIRRCKCRSGAALRFFDWVGKRDGYGHSSETYNMAMKIAGGAKDFERMRSLFYEMRRKGCSITPHTWTIMIMQYGRTGLTEIALGIFEEMKASGCEPSGSTYKYLIISLCGRKGRKVDEAVKLFRQMMKSKYVPDKEFVEIYLGCLCESDKLLDARKCVNFLREVGFSTALSYSLYIRALCRAGNLEEAQKLLNNAGAEREMLNKYVCGSIVHGLLRKGNLEAALSKVDEMKQAGVSPSVHVYTSLAVHYLKEKEIEKAEEVLETMKREGCEPTIVTYSALIRGYVGVGKVGDAWSVFNQMKSEGPSPDFRTYSMFMNCLCRIGRSEEALGLISEMLGDKIVPSSVNFRTVFSGLNREGKHDLARLVWQQKLDLAKQRKSMT